MYVYYFGPFDSYSEAKSFENGYVQDLKEEKAEIAYIHIKRCKPNQLTISIPSSLSA